MTITEQESLTELLVLVDQLYGHRGDGSRCRYRLGRSRTQWQFEIADDASRWESMGLKWQFRGKTPQQAIRSFLAYVQQHGINLADFAAVG